MFEPGDVVFYKTTNDGGSNANYTSLAPLDEKVDFPTLAAHAQSLPYHAAGRGYRPWYHVAMCVEGGDEPLLVGYESDSIPTGELGVLQSYRLEAGADDPVRLPGEPNGSQIGVEALRPPATPGFDLDACIQSLGHQVEAETPYSVAGLLVFAMATNAWMLHASDARTALLAEALGAETIARKLDADRPYPSESCVTAVTRALAAGGLHLDRVMPPPAPDQPIDNPDLIELKVMALTLQRLQRGHLGPGSGRCPHPDDGCASALELASLYHRYLRDAGHNTAVFGQDDRQLSGPLGRSLLSTIRSTVYDRFEDFGDIYTLIADRVPPEGTAPFAVKVSMTYIHHSDRDQHELRVHLDDIETDPAAIPEPTPWSGAVWGGGRDLSLLEYVTTLAEVFRTYFGDLTRPELRELGTPRLDEAIDGNNLMVSPAMLWDALIEAGFQPVTPTQEPSG